MKFIKVLLTTAILSASSIPVTAMSDSTETDIRATITGLEQALNENNIDKIQDIYSERAMVIPMAAGILDDNTAIAIFWDEQLNDGKSHYRINVIDLQVTNNIAYLSAMWSATVIRSADDTEIVEGYLSNVLERQDDGNWKIRIQNWN